MSRGRRAGVLLPVFSLPGDWGIGCLSRDAERFVAQLAEAGQSIWQMLPIGPTGYGDSPYQSFSTFAGNPNFIDLDDLVDQGLLAKGELLELHWGDDPTRVDYGAVSTARDRALRLAHSRLGRLDDEPDYQRFVVDQADWLEGYALFMTIKSGQELREWTQWPDELRHREPQALGRVRDLDAAEFEYQRWLQWQFHRQWQRLRAFMRDAGVQVLGDLPIYVAMDSADAWANPELFDLDDDLRPRELAGVPPDGFSPGGQLWGNPLYDWPAHKATGFAWWIRRLSRQFELFDTLRLDHFRGLESYYAVPYGDPDARDGLWRPGPGLDFFDRISAALGRLPMVAEDLGFLTDAVRVLRETANLPGMQVIQFAFDGREHSDYWPHNFVRDTVVYTGTHDNPPLQQWWVTLSAADRERARTYLNSWWTPPDQVHWDFIIAALTSIADTCIVPMPDYLGLGAEGRINTPSTNSGNWSWRMHADAFTPALVKRMARLAYLTQRSDS
ncbi:MAG: 4-alpha-glucanotransferase [Brooklawnia sp.]|uniref:4-alpha-glucanotransferase n=1 Tax=Brooklawnia sp. TaxID=2699740 RepID=UPI003C72868C